MSAYIIIGGHGKVARLAEPLLVAHGDSVSALIRRPEQKHDVEMSGAHAVVLDVESADVEDLARVFHGADAIIWSAGAGGGDAQRTYAVDRDAAMQSMDAAKLAHVKRYVMVSYWGAGSDLDRLGQSDAFRPYAQAKADADAYLRASDLQWTILGPTGLTMREPSGRITVGRPDKSYADLPATSRGNVAQVIMAVLTDDTTIHRTMEFHDGDTPIAQAVHSIPGNQCRSMR